MATDRMTIRADWVADVVGDLETDLASDVVDQS
jgi:hypothetical protein